MIYSIHRLTLFVLLSISISLANATDIVHYVESKKHPDPKQIYFVDLLTLALEMSKEQYGDYQLQPVAIEMAQGRTSMMLERNELIDLTWRMTSKDLEQKLQAIYFPLTKGLMGYRIFIIRKNDQNIFPRTLPLEKLKKIRLGQGHHWPDTDILLSNGFNVTKGYDIYLLEMLKKGRFNFYPRALHEPWLEIINEDELVVEQSLNTLPLYSFLLIKKINIYKKG